MTVNTIANRSFTATSQKTWSRRWDYLDPVKEVQSDILRLKYKLPGGTYAAIGAAQGRDWEMDLEQHAKERQLLLLLATGLKEDIPTTNTAGKENAE